MDGPLAGGVPLRHRPAGVSGDARVISVVVPCYNQAHYLPEALESVRAQKRGDLDLEVVVVDDGSTDATSRVAGGVPDVRVRRQRHRGLAAARNAGLRESTGALVVFLDADDRLLPGALAAGAEALARHPEAALVYGRYRHVDADGRPVVAPFGEIPDAPDEVDLLRVNCIGMIGAVTFRRAALEAAGGFETRLGACEDWDLYLRIARRSSIRRHDALVAEYRLHAGGMSRDAARMLAAASRVLRRQRRRARRDPRRREAWKAGRRWVETTWGEPLLADVIAARQAGARVALGTLAVLARHYPRGLLRHLCPRLTAVAADP
jgi:glycosyltransferase involved in cell wall biosynthesis